MTTDTDRPESIASDDTFPPPTEAEFQAQIIDLAHMLRWRVAHFRPARTAHGWRTAVSADGIGFPDLILARGRRLVAAELKRSERSKLTPAQVDWLAAFRSAGVEAYTWIPEDVEEIARCLA